MLTTTKELFKKAHGGHYAVGAFNVFNLESVQAVFLAAKNKHSPVIINVSEKSVRYAGLKNIVAIIKAMSEKNKEIPCTMQLDHGQTFESVKAVIEAGFKSVMIDGSRLDFEENIKLTKKVVDFARRHKVSVQAELGIVRYINEKLGARDLMTDPEQAKEFVKETKPDALAVSIGNAHGFIKEDHLDMARLEAIYKTVDIPLVLHGASDFPGKMAIQAIRRGVACFHIDTNIRVAFVDALRNTMKDLPLDNYDPRSILPYATIAMQKAIEEKMEFFGSAGKI